MASDPVLCAQLWCRKRRIRFSLDLPLHGTGKIKRAFAANFAILLLLRSSRTWTLMPQCAELRVLPTVVMVTGGKRGRESTSCTSI